MLKSIHSDLMLFVHAISYHGFLFRNVLLISCKASAACMGTIVFCSEEALRLSCVYICMHLCVFFT